MPNYPPPYIIGPESGHAHTHTIILLHGRSSTAEEFATDLFSLMTTSPSRGMRRAFPCARWVFLDAGQRWCTSFKEMRSAWFDTCSLDDLTFQQELQIAGLVDGISLVESTIEEEARRLCGKAENIVLGGFSQGCATALWALLVGAAMTKGRIGAFVGLSAWMPFMKEVKESVEVDLREEHSETVIQRLRHDIPEVLRIQPRVSRDFMQDCFKIPIYLGHGADDTLISIENCYQISSILTAVGATVSVREYVGAKRNGHWVKEPEQTDDIIRFLSKVLGTSDMPAVS